MTRLKDVSEEKIEEARRRYNEDQNEPLTSIAKTLKMSPSTFRRRMKEWGGFIPRPNAHPPILRPVAAQQQDDATELDLATRMQRAAERDLVAVERVAKSLSRGGRPFVEAERVARTLASLTRTLTKIAELRAADTASKPPDEENDDIPTDIDELRRALAARMARLAGEMECGRSDRGDDAG